jgi:hypothetical protein
MQDMTVLKRVGADFPLVQHSPHKDYNGAVMMTYEQQLSNDPRWALSEGSRHFEKASSVQVTLQRVTRRLSELGVSYAVAGGMALFHHGLRRFTEDVDILVTREGLRTIHESMDGLGYLPPFSGSKNLRDTNSGVRVEFLVAGEFPGDGRAKPVAFPKPDSVSIEHDGIRYLQLNALIELKLASGMTNPARLRDLSDVLELIRLLRLPVAFAEQLHPYVRDKFHELFAAAASAPTEPQP